MITGSQEINLAGLEYGQNSLHLMCRNDVVRVIQSKSEVTKCNSAFGQG